MREECLKLADEAAESGDYRTAIEHYRRGLTCKSGVDAQGKLRLARLRLGLAFSLNEIKAHREAACLAYRAALAFRRMPDQYNRAAQAFNTAGVAAWFCANPVQARRCFAAAFEVLSHASAPSEVLFFKVQRSLALSLHVTGHRDDAIDHFRSALRLAQVHASQAEIAEIRRMLSNAYQDNGNLDLAERLLDQARPDDGLPVMDRAKWWNATLLLRWRNGNPAAAIDAAHTLRSLFDEIEVQRRSEVGAILTNGGLLLADMGQKGYAVEFLEAVSDLDAQNRPLSMRLGLARLRAKLAFVEDDLEGALKELRIGDKLVRTQAAGDLYLREDFITNSAEILERIGREPEAIELIGGALAGVDEKRMADDAIPLALTYARLLARADQRDAAFEWANRAFVAQGGRGEPEAEWRAFSELADLFEVQGRHEPAILFGKIAVLSVSRTVAQLRLSCLSAATYLKARLAPFRNLISRLIAAGRHAEARQVEFMQSAEVLYTLTRGTRSQEKRAGDIDLAVPERVWMERYREITLALRASLSRHLDPDVSGRLRVAARGEAAHARRELQAHLAAAERFSLGQQPPVVPILRSTPVAPRTARLSYYGDEDQLRLHFLTCDTAVDEVVAKPVQAVSAGIYSLNSLIQRKADIQEAAKDLYQTLILPIEGHMAGVEAIEIAVPPGLDMLPFACLHDGSRYLVERTSLIRLTPAPRRRDVTIPLENWRIGAFGASAGTQTHGELRHVEEELHNLKAIRPDAEIFPGAQFTRAAFASALARAPQLLHISGHFRLHVADAQLSAILLGDGSWMTLGDLRAANLNLSDVALLALPACDTATAVPGTLGPESLAGMFQMMGARDVIGALWPVDDAASAAFMDHFYGRLFSSSASVADCVREAQLAMIAQAESASTQSGTAGGIGHVAEPANFAHPYYWSGFVNYAGGA